MKRIKITKLEERPDAEVKNNIAVNSYRIGTMIDEPKVGSRFRLYDVISINGFEPRSLTGFWTSTVEEIIDDKTFKTVNSIYIIEELSEEDN